MKQFSNEKFHHELIMKKDWDLSFGSKYWSADFFIVEAVRHIELPDNVEL